MKNLCVVATIVAAVLGYNVSYGQQIAGFDDLILGTNSYWVGSNQGSNDFTSGFANFSHQYDTAYSSWNGFAYSNLVDTVTEDWANQYACRPGIGAENSSNYGLFYQWANDSIWFDTAVNISGFYVTNSTLTALSMQNGNIFSKKFGGETGNDPDWFLLEIKGFGNNGTETGSIDFYLADYRFENNDEDYIVTNWQWVDLTLLNEVKTIKFILSSTDNGHWGMNTPAYFCLDELKSTINSNVISFNKGEFEIKAYPNPFSGTIFIKSGEEGKIQVSNINGQVVYSLIIKNSGEHVNLSGLENGMYFLTVYSSGGNETIKIVKH